LLTGKGGIRGFPAMDRLAANAKDDRRKRGLLLGAGVFWKGEVV
jgi:hypothetical protein